MIQIGASSATIDTPIEHLTACHRRIEQRLDTIVNAAAHLCDTPEAATLAIQKSFNFLDGSGALHTRDEEESVFPRLRSHLSPSESEFIDSLEAEHCEADSIYLKLKRLAQELSCEPSGDTLAAFAECAERLRDVYRKHIQAEDDILVPLACRCHDDTELGEISAEMRLRRRQP